MIAKPKGTYDVLVGINLLREGLDIPEVSLIAILDADKEGFLRSETSLIQIIGRAARNKNGKVIMYADNMTKSIENAVVETYRRRAIQEEYNRVHGVEPKTIVKEIQDGPKAVELVKEEFKSDFDLSHVDKLSKLEKDKIIKSLEKKMYEASKQLNFEEAMSLRDIIYELKSK